MSIPLQIPVPGGLELLVLLLILVVWILIIGAVIGGVIYLARRFTGNESDEVEELKSRVEQLEGEAEELKSELESRE